MDTLQEKDPGEDRFRGQISEIVKQDNKGIRLRISADDGNDLLMTITHPDIERFGLTEMLKPGTRIKWEMVRGVGFDNVELL